MTEEQIKTIRKAKAIEKENKQRLLKVCPTLNENSGIYILTREEDDFKYAYIGQAKHILTRLAQHLKGYQHIDLSIKKHGLYAEDNLTGWEIAFVELPENQLDIAEQRFIKQYADRGYQLRNKTSGSQDSTKRDISDTMRKGYQQGLHNGYEKCKKEISKLFEKNLIADMNGKRNKNKEKALQKFNEFIGK